MQAVRGIEQGGGPQAAKWIQWINFSPRVFPYGSYSRTRQRRRSFPEESAKAPLLENRGAFALYRNEARSGL